MMKRKRILSFAAVAAMMAACSSNDIPAPAVDKMADKPVTVNAAVADLATRATTALAEGSLGLYFTTEGNTGDTRYTVANKEVKFADNAWAIQGAPLLWKSSTAPVTYYAYHPYDASVSDGTITVTAAADQTNTLGTDFLYAACTATTGAESTDGIDIAFGHRMARLTVILRTGSAQDPATTYTGMTVGGLVDECTFNLATGAWNTPTKTETTDIQMKKRDDNASFEALLIPQTAAKLSVTILTGAGTEYLYEQAGVTLAPGKAYTLNLVVGKEKVQQASASATEWGTGENNTMETE